ncbi:hypothetical protein [Hymenobacter nivis]|uniref:Uncharacterized protein n=1 Tax=Hymenobacter nivis TaxID=1850093 RepID=A0A502G9W6_9BACT|nr:hypothetical protein [Hymenobacter nivis]TPG58422.1 hypothetical protein EAH73_22220 [Hymenobacter nivis]
MEPAPSSAASAVRLNGLLWFSIALLYLSAFVGRSEYALVYVLVVIPAVAGAGALLNLGLGLWNYATDRRRALPYLLGAIPLTVLGGWLWYSLNHLEKSW